ncbi:MAG: electron transfer flavoprotein subunit alpha/FixB family protein [Desulfarculaceae bacterium]|nr:electron transfer flavoprotein subunit alpha/FixB family protein [Desulfarculaceae bacterium]
MSLAGKPLVVAVAEHGPEGLAPVSLELAACARELAQALGGEARLLVLGDGVEPLASEAARLSGLTVTGLEVPGLTEFSGEAYRALLAELLPAWSPAMVLAAHTTSGLDWAPGLAMRLGVALVSGVEAIEHGESGPLFRRAAWHGKLSELVEAQAEPLVLTVQPGSFPALPPAETPGSVEVLTRELPPCRARVRPGQAPLERDAALGAASVVVAAGRGVGKPENLEPLRRLSALFSNAALAGSRPVCDLGWLGYARQVGLTGATVSPRLYLACGISGARQHTVGMQGSGYIVAINNDPNAAIFNLADVGVVEDLNAFIPALLELAGAGPGREG